MRQERRHSEQPPADDEPELPGDSEDEEPEAEQGRPRPDIRTPLEGI